MTKQTVISFEYDADLEIVTTDHQKLLLANSGAVDLLRPDKILGDSRRRILQRRDDL